MPIITGLERQKHNKSRVSVFVDGEYSFSVSDEIIVEYGICINMNVNSLPLKEITLNDQYKQALSCAFTHMSRSEKSEKQLREHLNKKEFSQETVEKVILRLKELNYLDDLNLAKNFVEHSNSGINAIRFKLRQKGISESDINEALEDISYDEQLETAIEFLKKQLPKYKKYELYDQKRRMNDFLARRGFSWEIISQAIETVFSAEDEL